MVGTPKFILETHYNFIHHHRCIIDILYIVLNAVNIFTHYRNTSKVLAWWILLSAMYLLVISTPYSEKVSLVVIVLLFSVITGATESFLISFSKNGALRYQNTLPGMNLPAWLFTAYFSMVVIYRLLDRYYQQVIVPIWKHLSPHMLGVGSSN